VWPTAHITELCLQLTAGSRPVNGDEHRTLRSQSCERALLTTGTLPYCCLSQNNFHSVPDVATVGERIVTGVAEFVGSLV